MSSNIQLIDKGLGELYKKRNKDGYYPKGDNKKPGLFQKWCDEQGFEEEDVNQELKAAPEDCMLVEFDKDDEFPFQHEIKGQDDAETKILKQIEIYNIIKLCIPSSNSAKLKRDPNFKYQHPNTINFDFEQKDYEESLNIYKKHVYYTLGHIGANERSLMNQLTVSRVNNGFPFLRYMVDSFGRDRIKNNFQGKTSALTVKDWFLSNTFCQNLVQRDRDKKTNKAQELKQAIVGYCNRISPQLQFATDIKINDSIKIIAQYLVAGTKFIAQIIDKKKNLLPFQCDIVIRFNGVVDDIGTVIPMENDENDENDENNDNDDDDKKQDKDGDNNDNNNDNNNNDEEDEEDDDEDPDYKPIINDVSNEIDYNYDYVGNVREKIDNEGCINHADAIPHGIKAMADNETPGDIISRQMIKAYEQFSRKVIDDNRYKDKGNDKEENKSKKMIHDTDIKETEEAAFEWPARRRFCAFIDRKDAARNKTDDLLFYEPPKDAKIFPIPSEFVQEWHFENLRKCIIPRKGYGDGKNEKYNLEEMKDLKPKERAEKATITSTESCYGQIGTFSFQVTQRDEISCYLFWGGQQIRFYPQDIIEVLPYIFVDKVSWKSLKGDVDDKKQEYEQQEETLIYDNNKFKQSQEAKKLASSILIQDFQFEAWYGDLCRVDDFPKYN